MHEEMSAGSEASTTNSPSTRFANPCDSRVRFPLRRGVRRWPRDHCPLSQKEIAMRRLVFTFGLLVGLASIAGCLELSQAFTLNPDGSGKVTVDTLSPAGNQFAPQGAPKP